MQLLLRYTATGVTMSPQGESGVLVGDAIREDRDALVTGSSQELQTNGFSEEESAPRQPVRTPQGELPSNDPLLVVMLRGVSVVVAILMPLVAIVLHFNGAMLATYESRSRLAVGSGFWAILAMWIILDKGLVSLLEQAHEAPATGWLLLGLGNLGAALGTLGYLVSNSR
jgi:hypothetical protein